MGSAINFKLFINLDEQVLRQEQDCNLFLSLGFPPYVPLSVFFFLIYTKGDREPSSFLMIAWLSSLPSSMTATVQII